jgi:hypothetical protein
MNEISGQERDALPVTWAELKLELHDIAVVLGRFAADLPREHVIQLRSDILRISADPRLPLSLFLQLALGSIHPSPAAPTADGEAEEPAPG